MARRYGRLNRYDSRIRRCAISGFRFYESEMIHTDGGMWVHPKYLDEDGKVHRTKKIGAPTIWDIAMHQDTWEEDSSGNLQPRDINLIGVDDYSAFDTSDSELSPGQGEHYSVFFERDGSGGIEPKSS